MLIVSLFLFLDGFQIASAAAASFLAIHFDMKKVCSTGSADFNFGSIERPYCHATPFFAPARAWLWKFVDHPATRGKRLYGKHPTGWRHRGA